MSKQTGAGKTGPFPHGSRRDGSARGSGQGAQRKGRGPGQGRGRRVVDPAELAEVAGRITALEEQKDPGRRSLFVDGVFVLGLDLETVIRCGLKVGQPVDGALLLRAHQMDQWKRTWDGALLLLAAAPRTAKDLGRRLGRSYPPEVVEQTLQRLEASGFLDDRAYAEGYIRSHREYGGRRLLADLIRKGVDREVATRVINEALGEVDEAEQAREAAARRLTRMDGVDRETARRRLTGYLARRGFGPGSISRALAPLLGSLPPAPPRTAPKPARQGKTSGWRRVEADGGEEAPARGGSTLRRSSSLQRRRPLNPADRFPEEE